MFRRLQTYGYAAASEGFVAICAFGVLFALRARHQGEVVATYLLIRKVVAVVVPVTTWGTPLSLVRHLVLCKGGGRRLIGVSALVVLAGISGLSIFSGFAGGAFTRFGLGASGYESYAWPIVVTVLGVGLTTITIGTFRARERVATATTVMIVNLGVMPLVFALLAPELWIFLTLVGGTQALVSLALLAGDLIPPWSRERVPTGDFLRFGAKATTAEFSLMVLLWLPPATIARTETIADSGYFSLILSMAMLLASPIAPVSISVMPRISAAVAGRDGAALNRIVFILAGLAGVGGTAMVVLGVVFYETLARLLLGTQGSLDQGATVMMLSVIVPFAVLFGLRNAIDVVWSPLHNTAILLGGIGVFLATYLGMERWMEIPTRSAVVLGFTLAVWLMAAVAVWHGILIVQKGRITADVSTP